MLQRTLPALLAAALWTMVFVPSNAQAKADKKSPNKPAAAAVGRASVNSEVVGLVNGKPVMTFGQLISKVQKASPPAFAAAVGQVMGQEITTAFFGTSPKSQVVYTQAQVLQSMRAHPPAVLGQALQQELSNELIRQAGAARHAEPTDAQLETLVTYLVKQKRQQMAQQVPATLSDEEFIKMLRPGLTRAKLKADPDIRISAIMFNLARLDLEKKLKHPITDADYVEARHILVKVDPLPATGATPEQKKADADALIKITKIYNDVSQKTIKFEDAAKMYSDDGSKDTGGSLGTFMDDGQMVKEFQDVAFVTKVGEVSKPFRSQFGYHILEVTKTGKEMKTTDRDTFLFDRLRAQTNLTYQALASQGKIVNRLQPEPTIPIPGGGGR